MSIPRNLATLAMGVNSSGVLDAANGGTGVATVGPVGQIFTSDGTSTPIWADPTAVASDGLVINNTTVASSYTIAAGTNAMSVGPMTVASGQAVTISSGQRWVIL